MSDWKPISTAPRDGEDVLLFFPTHEDWAQVLICHWLETGWYDQHVDSCPDAYTEDPTHWMPLPPLPRWGDA